MSRNLKIGHYVNSNSLVHRSSPRLKIAIFFALALSTFFITRPIELGIAFLVLLAFCALSRVSPVQLLRSVWGALFFLVLLACLNMFVINTGSVTFNFWIFHITDEGLNRAIIYAGRLAVLLLLGAILLATTSPISITDGLGLIFAPLKHFGVPVQTLAMILSLALRFVPVIADELSAISIAQKCRGVNLSHGGLAKRTRYAISLVVPVVVASLQHAEALSLALMSKSYEPGAPRTIWSYSEFKKRNRLK